MLQEQDTRTTKTTQVVLTLGGITGISLSAAQWGWHLEVSLLLSLLSVCQLLSEYETPFQCR